MVKKSFNFDKFLDELDNFDTVESIAELSSELINALMKKQRDIKIRDEVENKANGFYERKIASSLGKLGLNIPRDRKSSFRPSILPAHWQRTDKEFDEFLEKLILQSYSPNKIKSLLNSMNLNYSSEQVNEIKDELYTKAQELRTKELPGKVCALFIDAYHTDVKDDTTKKVKKSVIYTVVGIDLEGYKDIYGYYVMDGHETKEDWIHVFNDLISRGLKRSMLIVSDDFSGLSDAISNLMPKSLHQLCFVHLQRNIRKNLSKEFYKDFKEQLSIIKKQKDFETAVEMFTSLCEEYKSKNKTFIDYILKNKKLYFNFLKFPRAIQKHIYTTNIVENFNSRLEVNRINSGGYFQSKKTAEISIYVTIYKIQNSRWKKATPAFREVQYEINQMFNLMFTTNKQDN
jgi:putative transposase